MKNDEIEKKKEYSLSKDFINDIEELVDDNTLQQDKTTLEKIFNQIKYECNPNYSEEGFYHTVFNSYVNNTLSKSNFIGGANDNRNTLHENIFFKMFPYLEPQVHFGTGKGGFEKYGVKKYTADFYDKEIKTVYEIDGKNHSDVIQKLKDRKKELFFGLEHGIATIRFTNEQVEKLLLDRLKKLYKEGVLQ